MFKIWVESENFKNNCLIKLLNSLFNPQLLQYLTNLSLLFSKKFCLKSFKGMKIAKINKLKFLLLLFFFG